MTEQELLDDISLRMDGAVDALKSDLKTLRAGKASPDLLNNIFVDIYGSSMPINNVATITVPEARSLNVQVWDKSNVVSVEKAIANSKLELSFMSDGQLIRINLPPMSEQYRKDLVKTMGGYHEKSKVGLRNVRRGGISEAKDMEKQNILNKDQLRTLENKIQKITDEYIEKTNVMVKNKEDSILHI